LQLLHPLLQRLTELLLGLLLLKIYLLYDNWDKISFFTTATTISM
jgi:hypothetical protein